jgi:hypothetical protein
MVKRREWLLRVIEIMNSRVLRLKIKKYNITIPIRAQKHSKKLIIFLKK